jgi:hypothetical protein
LAAAAIGNRNGAAPLIKRAADFTDDPYSIRAEQHRPKDVESLRREVRRLTDQGLRIRDVAQSLKLNDYDVAILLSGGMP